MRRRITWGGRARGRRREGANIILRTVRERAKGNEKLFKRREMRRGNQRGRER